MITHSIRQALESDLSRIVEIYNETIPTRLATADTTPVTIADRKEWFQKHSDLRPIWVYEKENQILGWISFNSFYGRPAYRHTVEVSLYVTTAAHHQGIGKSLFSFALTQAPKLEIKTCLAFVFSHNEGSIRFIQSYGFREWGRLPEIAEMDAKEFDLSIYGLRLN